MNRRETERNHFSLDSCKSVSDETSMDRFMVDQFLLQIAPDHLDQLLDHRTGSIHRFWQLTFVQANSSTIFTTLPLSGDFWKIWDYIIWWYYHMWPYLTPWKVRSWFTRQIGLLQSTSYTDCSLFWQVFCHFAFQNSCWYISGYRDVFWHTILRAMHAVITRHARHVNPKWRWCPLRDQLCHF